MSESMGSPTGARHWSDCRPGCVTVHPAALVPLHAEPIGPVTPFAEGMAKARALAAEYGVPFGELRAWAGDDLSLTQPAGHGISSSDINHHLSEQARTEPARLIEECARLRDRAALVTRVAESTGRSEEETLANLRRLFAPADDGDPTP